MAGPMHGLATVANRLRGVRIVATDHLSHFGPAKCLDRQKMPVGAFAGLI
jgi:hypothetical protein